MLKDYLEVRDWLESFIPQTYSKKNLGLERIRYLLKLLGNPENKFKSIHVGGTSGKGSTAYYIARLLQFAGPVGSFHPASTEASAGKPAINVSAAVPLEAKRSGVGNPSTTATRKLRIGLHISPHLIYLGDRMQINGKPISVLRFVRLINEIKPFVAQMAGSQVVKPSYFEILVAASFKYFAQEKVDFAVVEVGLGGKYDATNVLKPEVSVITNVGLDHTDILGNSIEKIAGEKAGIIKDGVLIVTGASGKALKIFEKEAKRKNAPLIKLDIQLGVRPLKSDILLYKSLPNNIFRYIHNSFASSNKLLALSAVSALKIRLDRRGVEKSLKEGLEGRLEEIQPGVVLDGAHNVDKTNYLINWTQETIKHSDIPIYRSEFTLVLGFKKGKDWKKMIDILLKNLPIRKVIATEFNSPTDMGFFASVPAEEIEKYVKSVYGIQTKVCRNSQGAVFNALETIQLSNPLRPRSEASYPTIQLILVTGSLYLVGEARTLWKLPQF